MSVPVLVSPYRLNVSPSWAGVNTLTGAKIYGRLPSAPVSSGAPSDIWPGASLASPIAVRTLPVAQFTLGVVSDSTADNTGQIGALIVSIDYLDINYTPLTTQLAVTGQTVNSSAILNCFRIQGAQVVSAGSNGANVGNIYIVDASTAVVAGVPSSPTKVFAVIAPGYNTDGNSQYTIPAGFYGSVSQIVTDVINGTATVYNARVTVQAALYVGTPGAGALLPFQRAGIAGPSTSTETIKIRSDLMDNLTPGSELRFQASSTAAGAEVILIAEIMLSLGALSAGKP